MNILLTNIFIDLLLLALGFLKNLSTRNKQFSKFMMYYNFNCRLVFVDLYILFQPFQTVYMTQKLDSNFTYQFQCIVTCVIITTLRFLNIKSLINVSFFIFFKLVSGKVKGKEHSYGKSSWVLPIIKYDLVKFCPGQFFINLLVFVFKAMIDF